MSSNSSPFPDGGSIEPVVCVEAGTAESREDFEQEGTEATEGKTQNLNSRHRRLRMSQAFGTVSERFYLSNSQLFIHAESEPVTGSGFVVLLCSGVHYAKESMAGNSGSTN